MRRQLTVTPHIVPDGAKFVGDPTGLRFGRARIGDEDIRHVRLAFALLSGEFLVQRDSVRK
jgi:hypothetical protein